VRITSIKPQPRAYCQAALVDDVTQFVFVSGQTPQDEHGAVAESFDEQCRQTWSNVLAILREAGMTERSLVKVTVFLSDRAFQEANAAIRAEVLGEHRPALTVVIAGIFDEGWLLEIEAIAAT
jgi:2-iminobutanoate/2-iminopropanoate deaminase